MATLGSVEIKIGFSDGTHEVFIETAEDAESVVESYRVELGKDNGLLRLADPKGRLLVIPASRIAYLDLGSAEHRPVGFGALDN